MSSLYSGHFAEAKTDCCASAAKPIDFDMIQNVMGGLVFKLYRAGNCGHCCLFNLTENRNGV